MTSPLETPVDEAAPRPTRRRMPKQKPGQSKQDYQTPIEFLDAVRRRFGLEAFALDVASDEANHVAPLYYTAADDALAPANGWTTRSGGFFWCNPPYSRVGPWVAKAWAESRRGARGFVLIPAAVGSNYWRDYVDGKAFVLLLNGRITFVGCDTGYPKDGVLLVYGPDVAPGYQVWTWPASPQSEGLKP